MAEIKVRRNVEKIVQDYAYRLQKELKLRGIHIYGSFVNGNATEDSDIDVAVVADDFTGDQIEDTLRLMKIRRKVDVRIEPHPFQSEDFDLNHPHAKDILENGIEVSPRPVH
jgi:predicted nucleotidyltransferase